jgi:hypothetical protein
VAPARATELALLAQKQVKRRYAFYERIAGRPAGNGNGGAPAAPSAPPAGAAALLSPSRTAPTIPTPPPAKS